MLFRSVLFSCCLILSASAVTVSVTSHANEKSNPAVKGYAFELSPSSHPAGISAPRFLEKRLEQQHRLQEAQEQEHREEEREADSLSLTASCRKYKTCGECVTKKGSRLLIFKHSCQWDRETSECHSTLDAQRKKPRWVSESDQCPAENVQKLITVAKTMHEHFRESVATDANVFKKVAPQDVAEVVLGRESAWRRQGKEGTGDFSQGVAALYVRAKTGGPRIDLAEDMKAAGKKIWDAKVGTCGGFSGAAFYEILKLWVEKGWPEDDLPRIEFATLSNHGFLVIGREGSKLNYGEHFPDQSTWGKSAMIVDGWLASMGRDTIYSIPSKWGHNRDSHGTPKLEWERVNVPEAPVVQDRGNIEQQLQEQKDKKVQKQQKEAPAEEVDPMAQFIKKVFEENGGDAEKIADSLGIEDGDKVVFLRNFAKKDYSGDDGAGTFTEDYLSGKLV